MAPIIDKDGLHFADVAQTAIDKANKDGRHVFVFNQIEIPVNPGGNLDKLGELYQIIWQDTQDAECVPTLTVIG